jgi:hypothetical protein
MSEIQLPPTEPTTDLLPSAVFLDVCTSNLANAVFIESRRVSQLARLYHKVDQFLADHELHRRLSSASSDQASPRGEHIWIDNLGEAGYDVLRSIPAEIQKVAPEDFIATFRDANIAISGIDRDDAYEALLAEILDTFDSLTEEKSLGKSAAKQLRLLQKYIAKR